MFARFVPKFLEYRGPQEVFQYTITSYRMCLITVNGQDVVRVSLAFRRQLTSFLLTTCLPTILVITIGHITNHFDQVHFDHVHLDQVHFDQV